MCVLFSQKSNAVNITKSTDSTKVDYSIYHLKDNNTLNSSNIISKQFVKFPTSNNLGYNNGTYWIKIIVKKSLINQDLIAYIPTHNINRIDIYHLTNNTLSLDTSVGNSIKSEHLVIDYKYPSFNIGPIHGEEKTVFLKVHFPKEANFPIKIISKKEFSNYIIDKNSFNNFYYGTCLIIILLNIFFFLKFKEKTYLFYLLFLTSLCFNFLLFDGSFINFFRGNTNYYYLEMLIHFSSEIWFLLFSISFLSIHKTRPLLTKLLYIFPILVAIFYLIHIITKNYLYIAIADTIGITLLPLLWFVGFLYLKKSPHAIFYVFGYLLLIPFAVFFLIGHPFGFWEVRGDMKIIKIASWLDIFVFTYAISFRMKSNLENAEKKLIKLQSYINEFNEKTAFNNTSQKEKYLYLLKENNSTNKPLTLREIEVLKYLNEGYSNTKISEKLFISPNTIKSHIRNIYHKTDVKNRKELFNKFFPPPTN